MTLIQLLLGLVALFALFLIWRPAMARGFWPYTDDHTDHQKFQTEEIEATAVIYTGYWILAVANLYAIIFLLTRVVTRRQILAGLLVDCTAVVLAIWFHIAVRRYRKKKSLTRSF